MTCLINQIYKKGVMQNVNFDRFTIFWHKRPYLAIFLCNSGQELPVMMQFFTLFPYMKFNYSFCDIPTLKRFAGDMRLKSLGTDLDFSRTGGPSLNAFVDLHYFIRRLSF